MAQQTNNRNGRDRGGRQERPTNRRGADRRFNDRDRQPRQKREMRVEAEAVDDTAQTEFVFGHHASVEALKGETEINKVWLQSGLADKIRNEVMALAKKRGLIIQDAPKAKLDELTNGQNHQGVVLSIAAYAYATIDDLFAKAAEKSEAPFFLVLDSIEDPHNLGSILRTADAAGVHGIIIPKRRAVQLTSVVA